MTGKPISSLCLKLNITLFTADIYDSCRNFLNFAHTHSEAKNEHIADAACKPELSTFRP